jgi:hypothetical protein
MLSLLFYLTSFITLFPLKNVTPLGRSLALKNQQPVFPLVIPWIDQRGRSQSGHFFKWAGGSQ